jgi:hypothetical protein
MPSRAPHPQAAQRSQFLSEQRIPVSWRRAIGDNGYGLLVRDRNIRCTRQPPRAKCDRYHGHPAAVPYASNNRVGSNRFLNQHCEEKAVLEFNVARSGAQNSFANERADLIRDELIFRDVANSRRLVTRPRPTGLVKSTLAIELGLGRKAADAPDRRRANRLAGMQSRALIDVSAALGLAGQLRVARGPEGARWRRG